MMRRDKQKGFSAVIAIVIVLVIAALGLGGWYVWDQNQQDGSKKSDNKASQNHLNKQDKEEKPDLYEGWQSYSNATYGISFKYPAEWKVDEGAFNSPDSATSQEYAINVRRSEDVKYNETISIEVLGEDLDEAAQWYDDYFAQSPSNKVTRTTNRLKERESVQYAVTHVDGETKFYLFSVGSKTYLFTSIHEWLTLQADPDYWAKFDKVFDSLQFGPSSD